MRLGAVVLASGDGSRFEGGNKLLAPFMGKALIAHVFAALPPELFARRLAVTRSGEIATLARQSGLLALVHALPDISDTIRLGISKMTDTDGCLFCVGDQPYLSVDTVRRIVQSFENEPTRICRAAYDGQQGNPVIFPRALYDELAALTPGQSGGAVIQRHARLVKPIEAGERKELIDIDTREDYRRMEGVDNAFDR